MTYRRLVSKMRFDGSYVDIYYQNGNYVASIFGQLPIPYDDEYQDTIEKSHIIELVSLLFNRFRPKKVAKLSPQNVWETIYTNTD